MRPWTRTARKSLSAAVSAALVLLSSGFEPPRALGQVVQARFQAPSQAAGLQAVPLSLSRPVLGCAPQGTAFSVSREALPGVSVPALGEVSASPEIRLSPAGLLSGTVGPTELPVQAQGSVALPPTSANALPEVARDDGASAPAPSGDRKTARASGDGGSLPPGTPGAGSSSIASLSEDLAPHLTVAAGLKDSGAESASGVGRRIEAIILGLKAAPDGESAAAPALAGEAPVSGLKAPTPRTLGSEEVREGLETLPEARVESRSRPAKTGVLGRFKRWITGWFRVLPDRERNRQFWKFLLSQSLVLLGFSFHNTAMPNLAAPAGQAANLGYARAIGWASQAAANATTGPMIDHQPVQRTLVWVHLARTAALFLVPVLFFQGLLSFGFLLTVLFAAGFLESMSFSAEQVAQLRIMAGDEKHFNRVNAVTGLVHHIVGVVAPLLAGTFIGLMDGLLGPLAGSALSYGVYGVMALAGAFLFKKWLSLPREGVAKARAHFRDFLKNAKDRFPSVRGAYSASVKDGTVLVVEVAGDPSALNGMPSEFDGYKVKVVGRKSIKDSFKEFADGFRILWNDAFLRRTALLFPAVYLFAVDSVLYTALPRFISEVLNVSGGAAFFGGIPVLGPMVAALATKAGAFGLFLAAQSLGMGLSTFWMMMRQGRPGRGNDVLKDSPLERDGKWTSFLHGFGALAYWGIFFTTGLWGSVGAMLLASFLKGPASVAWWSVEQKVIRERYPEDAGKVFSAMFFYSLILSVAGVLAFGLLMETLPILTALWIVGGTMTVTAILDFIEPYAVFPISKRRAVK
ncbi:MAG: hypothetical protein HZB91_01020 [Elusimicrobia bacterium]|nr:hypothetical protein [Elusimicrobiota bacterium]